MGVVRGVGGVGIVGGVGGVGVVGVKKRGWARFCQLLYIQGRRDREGNVEREGEKVGKEGVILHVPFIIIRHLYDMYYLLRGVLLYCNNDWRVEDSVK